MLCKLKHVARRKCEHRAKYQPVSQLSSSVLKTKPKQVTWRQQVVCVVFLVSVYTRRRNDEKICINFRDERRAVAVAVVEAVATAAVGHFCMHNARFKIE